MNIGSNHLISVLHAEAPAPDRAEKLQLYGRFIGDWDTKIIAHAADGARHEGSGEIHFGWILEGRAIQDVWMVPRLAERPNAPPFPVAGNWFGTTIRVYDPNIDAWRIYWIDPARNIFRQQIGRQRGAGGQDRNGRTVAMELYQDHIEFVSLVGRVLCKRRQPMAIGCGGVGATQGGLVVLLPMPPNSYSADSNLRAKALASLQKIPDADIDDDKAGEYQGDGKPGFCVRSSRRLPLDGFALGGRTFERGNVPLGPSLRTGGKIGGSASPAHFTVIAPVNEIDGRLVCLGLSHLHEQRLITLKEGLGLCGQGGGAIQLRHHFPGRKIGAGPGVGTSRNQHVGSFDRHALSLFALPTHCRLPPEVAGSHSRSISAVSPK